MTRGPDARDLPGQRCGLPPDGTGGLDRSPSAQARDRLQPSPGLPRIHLMTFTVYKSTARPPLLSIGCLVAAALLAGCASVLDGEGSGGGATDEPGSAPYDHATGAEDVLVSIKSDGGLVPVEYNLRNTPEFLLLGDGTAIVGGVMIEIYPGPATNPLQSTTLTEDQIQDLFAEADQSGLLDNEIDYGQPAVTDVATTTVTITVGGRTITQSAYGLGFSEDPEPGLSAENVAAREAMQGFIDAAHALVDGGESTAYVPTGVVAYRLSTDAVAPVDEPDLVQPPVTWPITTAPAVPDATTSGVGTCLVVTGPDSATLVDAITQANELTPWLIGTDPPARMAFRPLLPGDPGCE